MADVNKIARIQEVKALLKPLVEEEKKLKRDIYAAMDENRSDVLVIDGRRAERTLVVQERVDTKAVKLMLGAETPVNEIEVVRMTIH